MKTIAQPNIRQDLLYIQTSSTALTSNIHGMSLLEDGEIIGPELPFLYHTPLDAIRDGWRVIQFPNTCRGRKSHPSRTRVNTRWNSDCNPQAGLNLG